MVLAMVALRIVVGWHFFHEGVAHKNDAAWTSEGFLRQAKGPFGEFYRSRAPGLHGFYVEVLSPMDARSADDAMAKMRQEEMQRAVRHDDDDAADANGQEGGRSRTDPEVARAMRSPVYGGWMTKILQDWGLRKDQIANHYQFDDEQIEQLDEILNGYDKRLVVLFEGDKEVAGIGGDIKGYRHELYRNQQQRAAAGADDIPNLLARRAVRDGNPTGEPISDQVETKPSDWLAEVRALDAAFEVEALALRTEEQRAAGDAPPFETELSRVDKGITWLLIIAGGCLVVGLFTRLSAWALAIFLLSVVLSQPFWDAESIKTTYFEWVELAALVVLGTSPVGRWAGLDFFIHHVLLRPFRSN